MAQAGYTPILIYASGTATNIPTSGNLISGSSGAELAINYADGKLYYKDGSGNVKLLSIGYGSSSVTPTNGGVQYGTGTALALTAAGSSGQILRSNGAAAPTWADLSTLGVNTISFGTTGLTPNSATAGAVTVAGTLVTANGGTGLGGATPFTANGVLYASSASALTSGSALTFDGTTFKASKAGSLAILAENTANTSAAYVQVTNTAGSTYLGQDSVGGYVGTSYSAPFLFYINNAERMRLTSTGLKSSIAGTNADPVFSYTSDTNTGIFFPAADKLGFTAGGGTDDMVLTTTGLGIGTSSPVTKLDVRGNTYIQSNSGFALTLNPGVDTVNTKFGITFTTPTYTGGIAAIRAERVGATDAGQLLFYTSPNGDLPNLRATLDPSGNLGLGVTPSAWSGGQAIQLGARGGLFYRTDLTSTELSANSYYNSGIGYVYQASAAAALYRQTSSQHQWFTAPSGTAGNAITFTQAMTLDASGNLSVGTTTIATQITFAGSSGITYQRSTDNTFAGVLDYLKSRGSAASPTAVQNGDDLFVLRVAPYHGSAYTYLTNTVVQVDGTFTSGQNPPTRIAWYTNAANGGATERARITSGGDFYINTTAAGGKFYVVSDLAANNGIRVDVPASFTASSIALVSATAAGTGWFFLTGESSGGSSRIQIRGDGNLYNANGTYGTISDARLKQDIVNAPSQWDDLKAVRFRKYRMKEDVAVDPNAPALLGVVAQELEQVCPGLVDEHTNTNGETIKTVKSSVLLMKAAVALQEAMARIETLEAKVSALEGN